MSKIKDLFIYVGHELPQRGKQRGSMVKIPGNRKNRCDILRLGAKHAIEGFIDSANMQRKLIAPQFIVHM